MPAPAPIGSPTPTPIPARPNSPDPVVTPAAFIGSCIDNVKEAGELTDTFTREEVIAWATEIQDACQAAEQ